MRTELMGRVWRRSQLVRFVVAGTINTAVGYGIYAGLVFLGMGYAIANLIALVLGILFSFKTQGYLVFDSRGNHLLGRFIISWALIYFMTIILIGQLMDQGLDPYLSGALVVPFSTVLSFLAQKYFVFRSVRKFSNKTLLSEEKSCPCDSA